MIVILIISAIILLILTALLIPLKLELQLTEKFEFKVKYAGFKILPKTKERTELKSQKIESEEKSKDNFIKKLFDDNDFPAFCRIIIDFLKTIFLQLKFILKHLSIKKLCVDITVASSDAATTAINYGLVCTAFYNLLKFVETLTNLKLKEINVNSDFEKTKSSFSFSAEISISPLYLLISAIVILKKYSKFTNREESALNERK